jgi:hypothetical protein
MNLMSNTKHGAIEWRWKATGDPSPSYKSLNYQWWIPNKSDFEIVSKVDVDIKQEIKNEIWDDMQKEIQYTKDLYKLHKQNKKGSK